MDLLGVSSWESFHMKHKVWTMEEVSSYHLLSLTAITVHHCHQVTLTLWVFVCVCVVCVYVHVCKYACDIGAPSLDGKVTSGRC